MGEEAAGVDQAGVQVGYLVAADEAHVHDELVLEELHGALHALLAVGAHGVEEGAADTDALGAQAERLDDVGAAADAAVDEDVDLGVEAALAQDGHGLGEDLDAGARKVELAAAVVGEDDAADAGVGGAQDVLDALDALEDDGHPGDGQEPGDVGPGEGRVDEAGDGAGGALAGVGLAARLHAAAAVGELGAHVLLAAAQLRGVDGDEQPLAAAALGVLDDAARDLAVAVDVELQPLDLVAAAGVDDLVEGARRQRGDHLHDAVGAGRARQHHLALRVAQLAQRGGRHVEGQLGAGAQHGGGEVDVLDVDEDLGAEPDAVVGAVVLAHGLEGEKGKGGVSSVAHTHTGERVSLQSGERWDRVGSQSRRQMHWSSIPRPPSSGSCSRRPRSRAGCSTATAAASARPSAGAPPPPGRPPWPPARRCPCPHHPGAWTWRGTCPGCLAGGWARTPLLRPCPAQIVSSQTCLVL